MDVNSRVISIPVVFKAGWDHQGSQSTQEVWADREVN